MSLSEQELRTLREMEASLLAEDPKFGASVAGGSSFGDYSGGRITLRGVALVVVSLVMLIGGVALAQQSLWFVALSIVGFLVMFGACIWMLQGGRGDSAGGSLRLRSTSASQDSGRGRGGRASGGGSSFGDRMEENFRRRFDEH